MSYVISCGNVKIVKVLNKVNRDEAVSELFIIVNLQGLSSIISLIHKHRSNAKLQMATVTYCTSYLNAKITYGNEQQSVSDKMYLHQGTVTHSFQCTVLQISASKQPAIDYFFFVILFHVSENRNILFVVSV